MSIISLKKRTNRAWHKWTYSVQKTFGERKWKMTMKLWWPIRNFFSDNFVRLNLTLARLDLLKLEGRSLSFCISDILASRIDERWVGKIVAGTKAENDAIWAKVTSEYREYYWYDDPDRGEQLANHFRNNGMLEQPRVADGEVEHPIYNGHWVGLFGRPFRLLLVR